MPGRGPGSLRSRSLLPTEQDTPRWHRGAGAGGICYIDVPVGAYELALFSLGPFFLLASHALADAHMAYVALTTL